MSVQVLFVAHDASATGVPTVLLRLVEAAAGEADLEPRVLFLRGGPLVGPARRLAPVAVVGAADGRGPLDLVELALAELGAVGAADRLQGVRVGAARGRAPTDVVHLVGAAAFRALGHLPPAPVLGHVHELEVALDRSLPPDRQDLLGRVDRLAAVASPVADLLARRTGLGREAIDRLPGLVPDEPPPPVVGPAERRAALGVPVGVPLVGAVGEVSWRKGADVFVRLAQRLRALGRDVHLVWVGADGSAGRTVAADLAASGLRDRVHLVGAQPDPYDWYRAVDILVVPSREDPLPLVVLEALQVGTPVVAAAQGGLPDLLGHGERGRLAPPLDVAALAEQVVAALDDPDGERARAERGRRYVAAHHTTSVVAGRTFAVLRALAAGEAPPGDR